MNKSGVRKSEIIVLTVGIIIVTGWHIARARFPAEMSGPNIGAGAVLGLGYLLILGGLAVIVGTIVSARRHRGRELVSGPC